MAESPPYTIDNPTTVKENLVTKSKGNFDALYTLLEPTALKGTATDAAARMGLEHSTLGAHTADIISEKTAGAGVTIDGVKCKDNIVYADGITEKTGSNDVPFFVPIQIDVIKEKTATSGITIDSGLLKDGDFVANAGDITSFKAAAAEVYAARGSKVSLDARLDITLNEDGTIKDSVIVLADLADGILTADAAGRLKMADGFIVDAKITDMAASKLTGSLNANTVATVSLQDGLLTNDAAGRAKMAGGFLSADAEGRAKMAGGFITDDKVSGVAGSKLTGTGFINSNKLQYATGTKQLIASNTETSTTATSYTKGKEIVVSRSGVISVYFEAKSTSSTYASYARIYVNGAAVGTQRTVQSTSYQVFTEDITVAANDLVQIYAYAYPSITIFLQNFRIRSNYYIQEAVTQDIF